MADECFVYRAFDHLGELLYVGMTKDLDLRFSQHERVAHWFGEVTSVTSEKFDNRRSAEARERSIILLEKPKHNIATHDVRAESAPSWDMLLDADEAAELQRAEADKAKALHAYNATRRLLKARCDARMRRAKESQNPVQTGGNDGKNQ